MSSAAWRVEGFAGKTCLVSLGKRRASHTKDAVRQRICLAASRLGLSYGSLWACWRPEAWPAAPGKGHCPVLHAAGGRGGLGDLGRHNIYLVVSKVASASGRVLGRKRSQRSTHKTLLCVAEKQWHVSYGVRAHAHLRAVDLKSTPLTARAN